MLAAALLMASAELAQEIERLRSEDASERAAALEKIVRAGRDAVPLLDELFRGGSPGLEERIGQATEDLRRGDWAAREEATQRLLAIGRRVLGHLEPLKGDEDPEVAVRAQVIAAELSTLAAQQAEAQARARQEEAACRAAARVGEAGLVGGLARMLGRPDATVRRAAVEALVAIGGPEAQNTLERAFRDEPDWRMRAWILRVMESEAGCRLAQEALEDPSLWVRGLALERRLEAAQREDVEVLVALLRSSDRMARAEGARIAARFGIEVDAAEPADEAVVERVRSAWPR